MGQIVIMLIDIRFLSREEGQAKYVEWHSTSPSEYTKRMTLNVKPTLPAPSDHEYLVFMKRQFLDFSKEEQHFLEKKFKEIELDCTKRSINLGSLRVNVALSTGKGSFQWTSYGDVIQVTCKSDFGLGLSDAMHPLKIKNFLFIDIIKLELTKTLYGFLFKLWLEQHPLQRKELLDALGYEEIDIELSGELKERTSPFFRNKAVKMNVILKDNQTAVSVVPVTYFNDNCRFDGSFKFRKETVEHKKLDFFSKGFVAVVKNDDNKYHLLMKGDKTWFITGKECDDSRVSNPFSLHGTYSNDPYSILERKFVNYLFEPKKLNPLILALFDAYFKSNSLSIGEKQESNEKQQLLMTYRNYHTIC